MPIIAILTFLHCDSDPKIDPSDPKMNPYCSTLDKLVSLPRFKLIAASNAPDPEFDLCDLCDPENQVQDFKTNSLSWGPMGKLYTKYQFDSYKTF